ncbi:response regulator [Gimesia aquarii]|uniref:Phosphate regulon transcriptional regulatory protein PhoB n=1 Tax=Gimesia aquarii TaxID=2527964 RepID=A0A517WTC6_9PLAN|nr:response regulator transcription factor [Gimesia aquarii]QDU08514.1 Phosphate regulon transcriptional regulatory protein PhoB [Gimesia aquarii]
MSKKRILVIEDDRSLSEVLAYNLRQEKYDAVVALDGMDGLRQAQLKTPDLIILDLMLPQMDGLEVCRRLRSDPVTSNVLILMLTAKSEETDQVVGFTLGADDYVPKPFSVKILLERIKALLRRRESNGEASDTIVSQGVMIDRRRHRVMIDDAPISLTRSEFELLEALVRQPGRVFSRAELIDAALGDDALVLERTIDVHIRALRQKLDKHSELIETVRGVGYRFRDPDTAFKKQTT